MTLSLRIKNKLYACNLIQGPLAGVSCAPFREQIYECAFSYTEMISCKTLIHGSSALQRRFVTKAPNEAPVSYQLCANDPIELGLGTRIATDNGADLIDLNCGCPVKKIRQKKSGSHLLSDATKIYSLIRAMKNNTDRPVSIKIRVDANSDDRFNQDIANAVADAEADFITVHGRHWTQGYDVNCFYDDIRFFVKALNIPVIGNGDVECIDSLRRMLATGCKGVMIARAGMGQPWLIQQLLAQMQEMPYSIPTIETIGLLFIKHLIGLSELLRSEKFAIIQARTFAKYYARNLAHKQAFCAAFNQCENLTMARHIIQEYFVEKT